MYTAFATTSNPFQNQSRDVFLNQTRSGRSPVMDDAGQLVLLASFYYLNVSSVRKRHYMSTYLRQSLILALLGFDSATTLAECLNQSTAIWTA